MKNKKLSIFIILLSIILLISATYLTLSGKADGSITGIFFGVGAGLVGVGIAHILENYFYKKNPELCKRKLIEQSDERNMAINNKARAKSGTMLMYLNFILAMIMSFFRIELWAVLALLFITTLYSLCTVFLIAKYNKS